MPNFDFISVPEFRESLESDYGEMTKCVEAKAWKGVQVLAGSIVEALLLDYLSATNTPPRPGKNPLKYDLAEAVTLCKSEKVISDRTADLCSVIRSYRNLIHPARLIRLGEEQPSEGSATIALALVDLIVTEVAKVRRSAFGLTAEQILSKLERDPNSLGILGHLLTEVQDAQKERLLLTLLPERYLELQAENLITDEEETLDRLRRLYRATLSLASDDVREKVAARFVEVLRTGHGDLVSTYSGTFFVPEDLKHVKPSQKGMVKQHFLSRLPQSQNTWTVLLSDSLVPFLEPSEVAAWLDSYIRTLVSTTESEDVRLVVRKHLVDSLNNVLNSKAEAAVDSRLDDWIRHFEGQERPAYVTAMKKLKEDIEANRLPF